MYARSSVRTKPSSVVVAAPCAGLAPTTHPTRSDARSSVRTKLLSVVVAAPCAGLAQPPHQQHILTLGTLVRASANNEQASRRQSLAHVYNRLITIRLSFACGRTKVRPYLSSI